MPIRKNLFLTIMLILGFLSGCSDKPSQTTKPAEITETQGAASVPAAELKPAYGDMIIIGSIGDASVLLPVLASDSASGDINGLIYNGLVKYDKDINLVGELAERWEISEDKLTIRFFLRKDVKWHDGKPFTSKDVEYTYKVYVDPKTPTAYSTDFLRVKEFRVIDDYTVEVVYEKPYAPALGSWGQGILPRHLLEGVEITESPLKRNPVGTGPYRFKDWATGEKIVLDSFHDYFDGRPYIDRVMTRIIPDLATMFLELKALSLDQMGLTPLQYVRQTDTKWFKDNFNKYKYLGLATPIWGTICKTGNSGTNASDRH